MAAGKKRVIVIGISAGLFVSVNAGCWGDFMRKGWDQKGKENVEVGTRK